MPGTIQVLAGGAHPAQWPRLPDDHGSGLSPCCPNCRAEGYGKALMSAAIAAISPEAPLPQVMIGDADYYWPVLGLFTN